MPARTPHMWMAMWAGVQKVSRPMVRCQEMSQCTPIIADVTLQGRAGMTTVPEVFRVTTVR